MKDYNLDSPELRRLGERMKARKLRKTSQLEAATEAAIAELENKNEALRTTTTDYKLEEETPKAATVHTAVEEVDPSQSDYWKNFLPLLVVPESVRAVPVDNTDEGTRADRNNNPLNIRYNASNPWLGRKTEKSDDAFEEFENMEYGYRAGFKNIATHINRGNNTYAKLISAWAPSSENNTSGYIDRVTKALGVDKDSEIDYNDLDVMVALAREMAKVESGHDVDDAPIIAGYKMARTGL